MKFEMLYSSHDIGEAIVDNVGFRNWSISGSTGLPGKTVYIPLYLPIGFFDIIWKKFTEKSFYSNAYSGACDFLMVGLRPKLKYSSIDNLDKIDFGIDCIQLAEQRSPYTYQKMEDSK